MPMLLYTCILVYDKTIIEKKKKGLRSKLRNRTVTGLTEHSFLSCTAQNKV